MLKHLVWLGSSLSLVCSVKAVSRNMSAVPASSKLVSSLYKVSEDKLYISRAGGWLTSRFHFSFAYWFRDAPPGFGSLRVMNDDLVLANNGFSLHPHKHMEIFTYVLEGRLSHGDTEENYETLNRGAIQFMSAGDGVMHEEMNNDANETCRFIQSWIVPDRKTYHDREVRYGSVSLTRKDRLNQMRQVIKPLKPDKKVKKSSTESTSATAATATVTAEEESSEPPVCDKMIEFRRDVNVFVSELEAKKSVSYELKAGRQAYMLCVEGTMDVIAVAPESSDKHKVSLLNREALCLFGPLQIEFIASGDGKDGSAMRHPDGPDGSDRSSGIGFVNGKRLKMDADDELGIDIYPAAHFMFFEMNKEGPYRKELES